MTTVTSEVEESKRRLRRRLTKQEGICDHRAVVLTNGIIGGALFIAAQIALDVYLVFR